MAQVVVRHLDEGLKQALKSRAAAHGRSMEEEIRQILRLSIAEEIPVQSALGTRMAERFASDPLDAPIPEWRDELIGPMDIGDEKPDDSA
ncbi:FitA-like ribbon-helix-helix domain-containing protein [Spiribacter pallidus]|uniref:Arc family DNA-binding protein n=1 Tax=Spiribacter pallidus TaxID=1987936 RepID=A0ABV3TB11_9GAMM